ncbi:MAG TPA: hypothetical protein VIK11_03750 [Tepidiformaceae bacterium]
MAKAETLDEGTFDMSVFKRLMRSMQVRAKLYPAALMIASTVMIGGGVVIASPASASNGNVTVTVTTNQCPKGGSVARIWYSIDNGGVVNAAGGDTASTWSQLGVLTHVTGTAFCKTAWWGGGYYNNFYQVPRYFWSNGYHTYI